MNLSIEASNLINKEPTGVPNYSRNLINNLLTIPEFSAHFKLSLLLASSRWKNRHVCPQFENVKTQWYVKRFLLSRNIDLIHYTGVFHNHFKKIPKIVTIHDIAVLKPEHNIPFYTSRETISKTKENMANISKNVDAIIFVSETTRRDYLDLYPYPEKQTSVVYNGSNFSSHMLPPHHTGILNRYGLIPGRYFLYLGGLSIRKNVLNLVRAFNRFPDRHDFKLVLAGNNGMGSELILDEIKKNDTAKNIVCTGFVTDDEVIDLYQNTSAFVFPTYYEGFGMPIIDAMNFGIPVLIGNKGAAPEISNGFATIVDPFDVESITLGLTTVLHSDPDRLSQAKDYAKEITWHNCATNTFAVYKQFL